MLHVVRARYENWLRRTRKQKAIARLLILPNLRRHFRRRIWRTSQINIPKISKESSTSMINASTAISAGKPRLRISAATMTVGIPTSINSQPRRRKRPSAKRRWKAVQSRPSATTAARLKARSLTAKRDGGKKKATALTECHHRCSADDRG